MSLVIVFVLGAAIGSFINVCAVRMPEDESIVRPGSHCRSCKKPVRWYDNIPCVSYFILRGRCRDCGARFSPQYVLVEIATGVLFVIFYGVFGLSPKGIIYLLFSLALFVSSLVDLRHRIIPDEITLSGIPAGLVLSAAFPVLHGRLTWQAGLAESFFGIIIGGGVLYVTATAVEYFVKKEAMGGGDVKLLGMIGAFLGWQGAVWSIFVSSLTGSAIGLYYRLIKGEETLAYGPHIALAAVLYIFFGREMVRQYFDSMHVLFSAV